MKRRIAGRAVRASRGWRANRNNDLGSGRRRMGKVKTPSGVPVWIAGSVVGHFGVFRAAAWVLNDYEVWRIVEVKLESWSECGGLCKSWECVDAVGKKARRGTKKFYTPLPALFAPPFQLGTTVSQAELFHTRISTRPHAIVCGCMWVWPNW